MNALRSLVALVGGASALALSAGIQAQDHDITYNGEVARIINEKGCSGTPSGLFYVMD